MKYAITILTFFITLSCSGGTFKERMAKRIDKKLDEKHRSLETHVTLNINGIDRKYLIHIPKKYSNANPTALILAFHGGGGFMELQADDTLYKLISKSEEKGFIIVFPNGHSQLPTGKFATWNAGKCCGDARDKNSDDVDFVKEIIKKSKLDYNIDTNKIYATGMSNGGMMSYRLACEMSDVFSGIAAVAGTDNTKDCNPVKPISILHIHAKNDDHVMFNGGAGEGASKKELITDFTSVPNTILKWVKFNSCNPIPRRVLQVSGAFCELYSSCKNNVEVKLCVTENGKHSWPGGVKRRGDEPPSNAISANDITWDFFKN